MHRPGGIIVIAGLVLLAIGLSTAQEGSTPSNKYFPLLLRQPGNQYLYDRFYDAWLETGTAKELEAFLRTNLEARKDLAGRLLLAFFYERQGQDEQALELYRTTPADLPVSAEYLFYRARAEMRHLDLERAIADLLRARALPCTEEMTEKIGKLLGELYVRTDQKDKAAALWKQLLDGGSESRQMYEDLVELQIREGLFADALETSDKLIAITKDPYKAVMYRLRQGDIHQYQANSDKALEVYAQALESVGEGSWLENQICAQIEKVFDRNDNTEGLRNHLAELVKKHPKRTGLKKRLANLLIQAGQTDKALALFQEILKATPGDRANQKAYVKTLTDAGELDKAIKLLEQLLELDGQDHEILIDLADLHHRNDQDAKAVGALNEFLDLSDKTEHTFLRVGNLLERYQQTEQAGTVYRRMIAALPASLSARQVYAEFLYRTDQKDEALRLFQTIAAKGDLQMMMRACNAAGTRGYNDQALRWAEGRYREFSGDVTYLNHLCKIAIRLGETDKAIVWARRQLKMAREFPAIRAALSQVVTATGTGARADELIRELQAAAQLPIQEMCLLSELLEAQGQPVKADAVLARAARVNPDIAAREQIHLYRLRHNWPRAAEATEALLERTGAREPHLIRELIELYQKCARYEDAVQWVKTWKRIAPGDASVSVYHAQLLGAMGKDEEAIQVLDAAQREFAGNTNVLAQLAKLYIATGKLDEAQRTYWRLYEAAENIPEKLRYVGLLSETAGKAGRRQELLEKLREQQQKNRGSALPLLAQAEVYKQMGQYEQRRQALLEAAGLKTDDIALLYELASVEEAQGDWQRATETLQKAQALDTSDKTRLKIARLYIQHGRREEGFRILTDVAGGANMDPRDAESIAGTMMSIGAWGRAISFLNEILSRHPKDYKLHYQYAVALEETGRTREAAEAFVGLLGFRDEIPNNPGKRVELKWMRQGVDTNIQRLLPDDAVALLKLTQCHATAYQHQRSRARYGHPQANRSKVLPQSIRLPPTIHDVQDFALSHILTLTRDMPAQSRAYVASDLRRYGVANVDLLIALGQFGPANFQQAIEDLAPRHLDDKAIQALWILQRIEQSGCTLGEAQRIFELFKDTHPRLALSMGLRCYGRNKIASRLFLESLQMLEQIPDPGYYEISAIVYVLENNQSAARLTEAQRAVLNSHLVDWFAKLKPTAPGRRQNFEYVGSLLARRRDLSDYVRFLDAEVAVQGRSAAPTLPTAPQAMVWHVPYPPRDIPGFPEHVISMVLNGPRYYAPSRPGRSKAKHDPARLGPYLNEVQDPTLKILIAMAAGRNEDVRMLTQKLLRDAPTSPAGYVLAASLAGVEGRYAEAVTHLEKVRSLPLSQQHHKRLDGALLAAALELDPQKHPAEIELGKRAALRLLSHRLNPEQQEELLVATETLGLTEQAANLKKQILASAANPSRAAGAPTSRHIRPSTVALTKKFFASGQLDSALRLALNHLRSESHDQLRYGYTIDASPLAQEIIALMRQHKAVDTFTQLAAPPTRATTSRLVEYGRICELLGQKAKAERAYEKAVAQDPADAGVRMQLALLSTRSDPKQGAQHLVAIGRREMNTAGLKLARTARSLLARGRIESALDIARIVTEYLDLLPDSEKQNLNWVDHLADGIAGACRDRNQRLHPLYQQQAPQGAGRTRRQRPGPITTRMVFAGSGGASWSRRTRINWGDSTPENTRAATKRRDAHNALCRKMIEIPQLAEAGFARLAAEAQARNALTDRFAQTARQALLIHQPYPGARPLGRTTSHPGRPALVNPTLYLVTQAHRRGTLEALIRELPAQLKRNGATERAEDLGQIAKLYTAPPGEFWDAADSLLARVAPRGTSRPQSSLENRTAFRAILDACLARELDQGQAIERFILSKIEQDVEQSYFVHQHLAEVWLQGLMERDHAAAKAFADAILALYESPKGRVGNLSFMFKPYAQMLASNFGMPNMQSPGTMGAAPSTTMRRQSSTSRTQRSRAPTQRSRSTRSRGRRRY